MTGWAVLTPRGAQAACAPAAVRRALGAEAVKAEAPKPPIEYTLTPAERDAAHDRMREIRRQRDARNRADAACGLRAALEALA